MRMTSGSERRGTRSLELVTTSRQRLEAVDLVGGDTMDLSSHQVSLANDGELWEVRRGPYRIWLMASRCNGSWGTLTVDNVTVMAEVTLTSTAFVGVLSELSWTKLVTEMLLVEDSGARRPNGLATVAIKGGWRHCTILGFSF